MKLDERLRRAGERLDTASADHQRRSRHLPSTRPVEPRLWPARQIVRLAETVNYPVAPRQRQGRRIVLLVATLAVLTAAAATVSVVADRDPDPVTTEPTDVGGVLLTPSGLLDLATGAEEPLTPGGLFPPVDFPAVAGPDGQVFYHSFRTAADLGDVDPQLIFGRNSIHVRDRAAGTDTLVADGARSVAVSSTGRMAFARGGNQDYSYGYVAEVVVQDQVGGQEQVWSAAPGEYTVVAWSGDRLLTHVKRSPTDPRQQDIVVFDGPGTSRILATDATLLALSPDGSSALVNQLHPVPAPAGSEGDLGNASLELVDVATGDTRPVDVGGELDGRATRASWVDDTVAVTVSRQPLAVLVYTATSLERDPGLTLEHTIGYGTEGEGPEPVDVWVTEDRASVAVLTEVSQRPSGSAPMGMTAANTEFQVLSCVLAEGACGARDLSISNSLTGMSQVRNPSRPVVPGLPEEMR